jgi:MerR family transcriptional regulator, light-induced transcriptional regulator
MRPPMGASMAILDALRDGPLPVRAVMRETTLSQSNVSNHLKRLRAHGWVAGERSGRQVLYHITDYFVEQFVRSQEQPGPSLGVRRRRRLAHELLPSLAAALSDGAEGRARDLVHEALLRGLSWQDLYLFLFAPALYDVGEAWRRGTLRIAGEHAATGIVERLMARIHPGGTPRPGAPVVLVACVEGNLHELGARMAADLFEAAGWEVRYLGANTPTAELARSGAHVDVAALSVSQASQLPALRETAAALRQDGCSPRPARASTSPSGSASLLPRPLIVTGGAAVAGQNPSGFGVDLVDGYLPWTLRCVERRLFGEETTDKSPGAAWPARPG